MRLYGMMIAAVALTLGLASVYAQTEQAAPAEGAVDTAVEAVAAPVEAAAEAVAAPVEAAAEAVAAPVEAAAEAVAAPAEEGMQDVESTSIDKVSYDAATQVLTVVFVSSGDTYMYKGVPQEVYDALMAAESKGAYFAENIKGKYEFEKQ